MINIHVFLYFGFPLCVLVFGFAAAWFHRKTMVAIPDLSFITPMENGPSGEEEIDHIFLPGGWYLVKNCDEDWFLSNPEHIWVAKFWDGPQAAESDVREFAKSLGMR